MFKEQKLREYFIDEIAGRLSLKFKKEAAEEYQQHIKQF
jgi:hypothetical protein